MRRRALQLAASGRKRAVSRPVPVGRFWGDPGAGKILTGGNAYTGSDPDPGSITDGNAWLDTNTGINHLFKRNYYTDLWSRSTVISWRNAGKMPSIAWKLSGDASNIADIAGGSRDSAVASEAVWAAGQGYPIYTAFFHEPEDNFEADSAAASYRAAYRRVVQIFRDNGAYNVVWCGVAHMAPWTFEGGEQAQNANTAGNTLIAGRRGPWYKWDPDWKGTRSGSGGTVPNASDWYTGSESVLDLLTFDTYTPEIGQTEYHEFSVSMDPCLTKMSAHGRTILPWVILEMGTKEASPMPGDGWTGFFQRAFRYMRDNGGVGFVYYNTDMNNFFNAPDFAARRAGYEAALASEASYLVSTRPADVGVAPPPPSTDITFVGAGRAGGNTTPISVPLPGTRQNGDVALLFWSHSSTAIPTPGPPAGWTSAQVNGTNPVAEVWWRTLDGTEGGSVAITLDAASRNSAIIVVYRNVHSTSPIDAIAVDTTHTGETTTHNNPPVTTVNSNSVIVTSIHERASSVDTDWTSPTGYTERQDTQTLATGNGGSITAVADNGPTPVSSGTTVTPPVWTGDNATGTANIVTYTVALRPTV